MRRSTPVTRMRGTSTRARRVAPDVVAELAYRLTGRDRLILELVWEHRVLTSHQLTDIAFGSASKARHRLLQLHTLSALARFQPWTPVGSQPMHWVLGPAGAYVLAAQRGITVAELGYRDPLAICHSSILGHQVGVNGFFAGLHRHARRTGDGSAVTAWWPERRCAALWGDLARPDAYGRWVVESQGPAKVDFFLEHDTGTEALSRVAAKLNGYAALAETTGIATPVLFWLPGHQRETHLRALIGDTAVPVATAVQTPATDLHGPAGPVWLPARSTEARRSLIELADAWPGLGARRSDPAPGGG